jgi:hypothetical protein
MRPQNQGETFATGMVRPKTTALFFDKLWVHPTLIQGFDPKDGLEPDRVPPGLCMTKPMGAEDYYESTLTQRAWFVSKRGEVMHTDATEALRRLSAESWDLNTIFQVETWQQFKQMESPLSKELCERLNLGMLPNWGKDDEWELFVSTQRRNKAIAFIVKLYAARGIRLTPIYLTPSEYDEMTAQEGTGLEICLNNIPTVVDSKLTWEQVYEFRKDKDAVQKLDHLRRWFTIDLAKKSQEEIKAILAKKLDDYEYSLKKHGVQTALAGTTSVLSFIGGPTVLQLLASSPLAAAMGGLVVAAGAIAWIGKCWIERSDLKRNDVAYIYDVKKKAKKLVV